MVEERNVGQEMRKAAEYFIKVSNETFSKGGGLVKGFDELRNTKKGFPFKTSEWKEISTKIANTYEIFRNIPFVKFKETYGKGLENYYTRKYKNIEDSPNASEGTIPFLLKNEDYEKMLNNIKNRAIKKIGKPVTLSDFVVYFDEDLWGRFQYNRTEDTPKFEIKYRNSDIESMELLSRTLDADFVTNNIIFNISNKEDNEKLVKNTGKYLASLIGKNVNPIDAKFRWNEKSFAYDGSLTKTVGSKINMGGKIESMHMEDGTARLNLYYTISSDPNCSYKRMIIPEEEFETLEQRINSIVSG